MSKIYPKFVKYKIFTKISTRFFIISFILSLCLTNVSVTVNKLNLGMLANAQNQNVNHLVKSGINFYHLSNFKKAIEEWEAALKIYKSDNNNKLAEKAVILGNLANAYRQLGNIEQTAINWEKVVSLYNRLKNPRETGRALTELAQAYSSLGQPKKAIEILCNADSESEIEKKVKNESNCLAESSLQIARTQKDKIGEVAALGSLGEVYRQLAKYNDAIEKLEEAKKINGESNSFLITNSLGSVYFSQAQLWSLRAESAKINDSERYEEFLKKTKFYFEKADKNFHESSQDAQYQNNKPAKLRALLNLSKLYLHSQKNDTESTIFDKNKIKQFTQEALNILYQLPDSSQKVYAAIDLANLPDNDSTTSVTSPLTQCIVKRQFPDTEVITLLNKAVEIGNNIQDSRSESFALGAKGHFYECKKDYNKAIELTNAAILVADQKLKVQDSIYLWEWQQGRLLEKKGKHLEATAAYKRAFQTLEKIRRDILTADRDLQLDFRDVIRPLYRQLAQLKLENVKQLNNLSLQQKQEKDTRLNSLNQPLTEARQIIDSLKLAELQNYFGNECILAAITPRRVDELLKDDTAVFSSIILENKVAILLNLPNKKQYFKWVEENGEEITSEKLSEKVENFRKGLANARKETNYDTNQAANLYDLIIAPFEPYLNAKSSNNQIKTLVFVQDGFLRSIPMSALYNKKKSQYLIENYAIATTPSLELTAPKKLKAETSRAMILAVSEVANIDGKKWDALLNVPTEVENIQKIFPAKTLLKNQDFTLEKVKERLKKTTYPIIHIATHAQFGIIPEDTFLVAGNNQKITINDLQKTLKEFTNDINVVELLALTACQTAMGDDRTTLGLAGVALQIGVRSTLASLWSVDDESTPIIVEKFYQNLRADKSKAEALQLAQRNLLEQKDKPYSNPGFWASFVMIGNWL
ncbi:MAG: CHAT domain-containing protein [Scytonematopsis contorta HA4267-MV1]|nr:CHAT domain-containing protein [Scytonematopsis contorta HA4267-MV1]